MVIAHCFFSENCTLFLLILAKCCCWIKKMQSTQ